ncbi:MAG: bifunctional diaminohydroxyphosphoribosylaminopyrimidine deaminase/5-amino-6-(5-phosphoribosylamino)uracil reductase RibD [Alsobacter sp.]
MTTAAASPEGALAVQDRETMLHALALGRRGLGNTWPNPAVGAVVWLPGEGAPHILGRGWTMPGGRPHAETAALAAAGETARGAMLSVTLEPCSHHGRTPPCSGAIVAAGIARVVSAIEDPDPRVNGRGHIMLRAHGIAVTVGVLAREARRANWGFIRKVVDQRPMLTLKLARTTDGLAGRPGERLMITGPATNARTHMLRAQHDAVMVGLGTVLADDPLLTCRLPGLEHRSPVRVVLDSRLQLPLASRLVASARTHPLWVVAGTEAPKVSEAALVATGAEVIRVAADPEGRVSPAAALRALAGRGITRVLSEAGPRLAAALAAADVIDEVVLLTGTMPAGQGVPALSPVLAERLADPDLFTAGPVEPVGPLAAGSGAADTMQVFTRRG